MNTIIVPISKITEYMRKQKELGKDNFKEVYGLDFIFEKFKLILTDDDGFKRTWIVELHDKCKEGYAETKGSDLIIHWVGDNVEIAVPAFSQFFNDDEKLIEQRGSITKTLILGIIWYIMTANRKRIVKEKEACAKREKSKEKERRDYDKKFFCLMKLWNI